MQTILRRGGGCGELLWCGLSAARVFSAPSVTRLASSSSSNYEREYRASIDEPAAFWQSKVNSIEWYAKPTQTLDSSQTPFDKWFVGGSLNAAHNCLDVHVASGHGAQAAIVHDSPVTSTLDTWTYKRLHDEVARFAGVLVNNGVRGGDRVLIYMPMIPQTIVAMLASGWC